MSDQQLAEWLLGSDRLHKLFFVDLAVAIKIDPSDNCKVVDFRSSASLLFKKSFKIFEVNVLHGAVVHCVIRCLSFVAFAGLQLLLQVFDGSVKLDFLKKQLGQVLFDVQSEVVKLVADLVWTLCCCGSELAIGARQNYLHEVGVVKLTVKIRIKKFD